MKFCVTYCVRTPPNSVLQQIATGNMGQRIIAASDYADCVNKTKAMINDGYKITGIVQVPEHVEVTPWVK